MDSNKKHALLLKPDDATDHTLGPASARAVIVEYGDFECPSCARAHGAIKIMLKDFGDKVRFVFRHYPQAAAHPHAELAAEAAEAAGAQGHFWPYHDILFTHQDHLKEKDLKGYAEEVGLDMPRYMNEMSDHVYLQRVQEHLTGGRLLGIRATPALFVNGASTDVSFGLQHLHETVEKRLHGAH
jgi:protein-disulfide isomerase